MIYEGVVDDDTVLTKDVVTRARDQSVLSLRCAEYILYCVTAGNAGDLGLCKCAVWTLP